MTQYSPRAVLRDRVRSIAIIETCDAQQTVLPSSGAVLGLQLGGRVRAGDTLLSEAGVTGIQSSARDYAYIGKTTSLLVYFTAQGAASLGVPPSELAGRSVALDAILAPARVRELHGRLFDTADAARRVTLIEELLLTLPFAADPLVGKAVEIITDAGDADAATVASLARTLALSERQFERRFVQRIGITPKRFAALQRFERALSRLRARPQQSLTTIAMEAGYYDQSHFIRDFRRFANVAPGAFLRAPR